MKYPRGYWLNEDSRTFLSRDYLNPGQSAEERIDEIVARFAHLIQDNVIAEKFKDYLMRGWFSLASPIWTNYGNNRGLPISCVIGETPIDTNEGSKLARDIRVGDMVLTHNGRYRRVTDVIVTENRNDTFALLVSETLSPIILTGNHPVLTNLGWVETKDLDGGLHTVATVSPFFGYSHVTAENVLVYKAINSCVFLGESHTVYDFTVEEDHSFTSNRVVLHNCNGAFVDDSIASIFEKATEIAVQSQYGAGTSLFIGDIRPRGTPISKGGTTQGPIDFLDVYEATINSVSQSQVRRGSCAIYLPVEHPDVMEFLELREESSTIQNLSLGITISDEWMESLLAGDKNKAKIWARIIRKRFESGYPYIMFSDTVNENTVDVYKDKGMKIHASNLCCFTGDTIVAVADGRAGVTIEELAKSGKPFPVLSATPNNYRKFVGERREGQPDQPAWFKEVKFATAFSTGTKAVVRVTLSDESSFCVTEDHLLATIDGKYVEVRDSVGVHLEPFRNLIDTGIQNIIFVEKIEELGETVVYDLNVESNHNFYIITNLGDNYEHSSGILVHNCEIALPSTVDETFVCCLSSLNLVHYNEWKHTDAVKVLTYFLDTVMEEYIEKTATIPHMEAAHRFSKRHRAIGVGTLGYHSFLQDNGIPFESEEARQYNIEIHKFVEEQSYEASSELALIFGEPEVLIGYGRRNTTLNTNPPSTSSSFILGQVSPSIEPLNSNYFIKELAKGKFTYKNPYLAEVFEKYGRNNKETWDIVLKNAGSVQNLGFLSDREKATFKTFDEISQYEIIKQAADRQEFIDQSQSVNLMIHPDTPVKQVSLLLIEAWKMGVKSLYYQRSISKARELSRNPSTCVACEV